MKCHRLGPVLSAIALLFLAVACDPVVHPGFEVVEGPRSAVAAQLLSADGNFVVATATAAGATVPGPGTWRVDRRDGSVVKLPDGHQATAISSDGRRVLLSDSNSNPVVWSNGTVLASPATQMELSPDITFGLFIDSQGLGQRWNVRTGAITPVETGIARPNGASATPLAVSDDGRVVALALNRSCCIARFIDVVAHTAKDVPSTPGTGDVSDRFVLSADGSAFVHHHIDQSLDFNQQPPRWVADSNWVELVTRDSLTVRRHYDLPDGRFVAALAIAQKGTPAWVIQELYEYQWDGGDQCGFATPTPYQCVVASEAVVMTRAGTRSFSTGGGFLGRTSFTASGRFFAAEREQAFAEGHPSFWGPARVVDQVASNVETLSQGVDYQSNDSSVCGRLSKPTPCTVRALAVRPQVSGDGRLIVSTSSTGRGWYEYTAG